MDENDNEVKAMVVDSDDAGEDDAVAAVVEEAVPPKPADATSSSTTPKPPRKPANPALRPVRLPPMSSPGLLIPPVSGVFRGAADTNGNTTPASVFDHAMGLAGYTTEGRIKRPHRGSSVQRVVSDMFDSNVKFALHFPKLIPKDLLPTKKQGEDDYDGDGNINQSAPRSKIHPHDARYPLHKVSSAAVRRHHYRRESPRCETKIHHTFPRSVPDA
jgi:hypothetical protein